MSYSSIRKQIDQLTFPPPPDLIKARQAEALPPALPDTADDSQIADHVSKLDAAAAGLKEFRQGLAAETASLFANKAPSELISAPKAFESPGSGAFLAEPAALRLSEEVGRQFATSVSQGVTVEERPQFLKGLS